MGDIGFCFAYLCGWCCCSKTEPSADGNHFRGAPKRHPKEQQVDDAFMAKEYVKGKSGQFKIRNASKEQMQPTLPPLPALQPLEPFKGMRSSMDPGGPSMPETKADDGVAPSGHSKTDPL